MPTFAPLPDAPRGSRSGPQIPRGLGGADDPREDPSSPTADVSPDARTDQNGDGAADPTPARDESAEEEPPESPAPEALESPASEAPESPAPEALESPAPEAIGAEPATGLPPVSEAPISPSQTSPATPRPPSRPMLASEALIEDLAPVEPLGQNARTLSVVAGVVFVLLGAVPVIGVEIGGRAAVFPSLVAGAVTLFAAFAQVTYRKRAVAMVALGAIVAALGIAGMGPARGTAEGGAIWSAARTIAAAALPATLLFRARYRAFEGARLLLGLGFLAALPYAVHAVLLVIDPATPFGFAQIGALLALTFLVAGLPGFMGSETTAAGSFVAPAMIVAFALQAGLQRLGALVPGSLADILGVAQAATVEAVQSATEEPEVLRSAPTVALPASALWDSAMTAVGFAGSALLSAVGLFQILAWKFAPVARKIDVRKPTEAIPEDRQSAEEWSTRG